LFTVVFICFQTHIYKFNDARETLSAALHHLDNSAIKDDLLWIDLNTTQGRRVMECDIGACDPSSSKKRELDLIDLDEISEDVYKSLSPGTLLIVCTQGVRKKLYKTIAYHVFCFLIAIYLFIETKTNNRTYYLFASRYVKNEGITGKKMLWNGQMM
jgi:hypothetical protein